MGLMVKVILACVLLLAIGGSLLASAVINMVK